MHYKSALKQLHFPVQDFLQLHFTSSRHRLDASGNSVHDGDYLPQLPSPKVRIPIIIKFMSSDATLMTVK